MQFSTLFNRPIFSPYILSFVLSILLAFSGSAVAGDVKTVKMTLKRGESIDIQTMYSVYRKTCKWDVNPPVPHITRIPKLGKVEFWQGKAVPHQCPSISIDANFARYIAGNSAGKDSFRIRWKATTGNTTFERVYKITVE